MVQKKTAQTKSISNRRARHDYDIKDDFIVGIALTGAETKALRMGHGHIRGAYVTVKGSELYLLNATITGTTNVKLTESEQTRTRKLLAKRREIDDLIAAKQQGQAIVPLEVLTQGRYIKVRIAVGRGRRMFDKRQALKKHDEDRAMRAAMKSR